MLASLVRLGCLVLGLAAFFHSSAIAAEPRVALVIGNSNYGPEIGKLLNPANDAQLMADTLKDLGFSVDLVLDADQKAMKRAVKSFGAKLRDAGSEATGLFYYAGHGVQVEGENFLLPIGAEIEAEADVEIESLAAADVMTQMESAGNRVSLVFLDACRNNPLAKANRSGTRGLARLDAPRGSFVGYSTAPGDVAADGDGANSPYAMALAEELRKPGISIEEAHRNVRARVLAETGDKQTPWDSSSLTGEVILASVDPQVQPSQATSGASDKESLFWESIKDSGNASLFESYLSRFPNGTFVEIALAKLAELGRGSSSEPESLVAAPDQAGLTFVVEDVDGLYVTKQAANVRAEPSTEAAIVDRLGPEQSVPVTGKVKQLDWFRVSVGGKVGYISTKLLTQSSAEEVEAWRSVLKAPDESGLTAFLTNFPSGAFAQSAKKQLDQIRKSSQVAIQQSAEESDWRRIKDSTDPALFRRYLLAYPDGRFSGAAKAQLSSLGEPLTEREQPTFAITIEIANWISGYYTDIAASKTGAFAVSLDGKSSYYVFCEKYAPCGITAVKAEALKECERRSGQSCFVLIENDKKTRNYAVN